MAEDTRTPENPQGGQPPTPTPNPAPNPDPVAELQRKIEQLEKQNADKDRFITDLSATTKTLEARINQVGRPPQEKTADLDLQKEAQEILETAQLDPAKAGERLSDLVSRVSEKSKKDLLDNLGPVIEQQTYVAKVKAENADLIELGLEPSIGIRAQQLMQSGKSFKESVDTAVKEAKEKVNKLKSNAPPVPPPPAAVGEQGSNRQPTPPPPPAEITEADEIKAEQERRRKSGL